MVVFDLFELMKGARRATGISSKNILSDNLT